MKEYVLLLSDCSLFQGIRLTELDSMLECVGARKKIYKKDTYVFLAESETSYFGIVLSGAVIIVEDDFWGNRNIIERIERGGLIGAAFSFGGTTKLPVSVIATEDSEVLLINSKRISLTCSSVCPFHTKLINNLLRNMAQKNTFLLRKIEHLSRRSTREKLLSYLSSQAFKSRKSEKFRESGTTAVTFEIPFNRQELADYLALDRSAMSSELCRMRDEGILEFKKNRFTLHKA
ncbi:MAG: Crp/Fnr family transcriptional regulator [Treponema sp.]|nr:Crp/Fnr family transcriptional regulator [Treponema sp.]